MPYKSTAENIEYPPGCKELGEDLNRDELLRRLKILVYHFRDMSQEEPMPYSDLALYLASDFFLEHPSKDVRINVACCIADVFRVCAPDAPYTEPYMIKNIFNFFTQELRGLENQDSPSFKSYFYLLENLSWVKPFSICIDLEESVDIFTELMKVLFSLVNESHSNKVQNFILEMLIPLMTEQDVVAPPLLDIIFMNLLEPRKTQARIAYNISRDLIVKTAQNLEPSVTTYLNNILMLGKNSEGEIAKRLYNLIYELNSIESSLLASVLPQLEFRLKSSDEKDRRDATRMLSKMFSAPGSELASLYHPLWQCFLGRFNDINVDVRRVCVRGSADFIVNQPSLLKDITDYLKQRLCDQEENVRMDLIQAISLAAKKEPKHMSEELLECITERTLDTKFKVRKEALMGLGQIYKRLMQEENLTEEQETMCMIIRNKILHAYYRESVDDRIVVERLLNSSLVPYSLDAQDRMDRLYYLYAKIDENAKKALHELWKTQHNLWNNLRLLMDLIQDDTLALDAKAMQIQGRLRVLSRNLPDPTKNFQHLKKICDLITNQTKLQQHVAKLVSARDCTCQQAQDCMKEILRCMGNPVPQNLLHTSMKYLLERVSPVMVDSEAIQALIQFTEDTVHARNNASMKVEKASLKAIKLLQALSHVFSGAFQNKKVYNHLIKFVKYEEDDAISDGALEIITNIGSKLQEEFPQVYSTLIPILSKLIKIGAPRQVKHAIKCVHKVSKNHAHVFEEVFEHLRKCMDVESPYFISSLIAIGHIAQLCPGEFSSPVKGIITKFIVKRLLMQDRGMSDASRSDSWMDDDLVSEETTAKVQGLKLMVRWLLGIKEPKNHLVKSTLRLLYTVMYNNGDLVESGKINKAEMARLRLQSGHCMLKLAQEPLYQDHITLDHFQVLSLLINDPCYEVRKRFTVKLNKGLLSLRLPLQYLSIMALANNDTVKERRLHAKACITKNVVKRREVLKQNSMQGNMQSKIYLYLPDYVLPYTIHLLAHDPDLQDNGDVDTLRTIKDCLWFILEPLMAKAESYNYAFYRKLIENIKQTRDAQNPDCDASNYKLYAVCDLAMDLVMTKTTNFVLKEFPAEPLLPAKLFTKIDLTKLNARSYLPKELQLLNTSKYGAPITAAVINNKAIPTAPVLQMPAKQNAGSKTTDDAHKTVPANQSTDKIGSRVPVKGLVDGDDEDDDDESMNDNDAKAEQNDEDSVDDAQSTASSSQMDDSTQRASTATSSSTQNIKSGPGRPKKRGRPPKNASDGAKTEKAVQGKITDFVSSGAKAKKSSSSTATKKPKLSDEPLAAANASSKANAPSDTRKTTKPADTNHKSNVRIAKKRAVVLEEDSQSDHTDDSAPKRKRGRPRKESQDSSSSRATTPPSTPSRSSAPSTPKSTPSSLLSLSQSPRRSSREITPSKNAIYIRENVMKKKTAVNGISSSTQSSSTSSSAKQSKTAVNTRTAVTTTQKKKQNLKQPPKKKKS